jgi:hypothetical protein
MNFAGAIMAVEFVLQEQGLRSELRQVVLGRGSRLEVRFNAEGASFRVGHADAAEAARGGRLWELWDDVFRRARDSHHTLVLIRICDEHVWSRYPGRSVYYCTAERPSWLPVAL